MNTGTSMSFNFKGMDTMVRGYCGGSDEDGKEKTGYTIQKCSNTIGKWKRLGCLKENGLHGGSVFLRQSGIIPVHQSQKTVYIDGYITFERLI